MAIPDPAPVHFFTSTVRAEAECSIPGRIQDGAVLVVAAERVVGVFADGLPVGVSQTKGSFHTYVEDLALARGGRYAASVAAARAWAACLDRQIEVAICPSNTDLVVLRAPAPRGDYPLMVERATFELFIADAKAGRYDELEDPFSGTGPSRLDA